MSDFRPITDLWILARPKVKYYGAYPAGFLERARALLGVNINEPLLHVCSGRVRDYPFRGVGPNDKTVDVNEALAPDYVMDVSEGELPVDREWPAVLADPPYTKDDALHYGFEPLPGATRLLRDCLQIVRPGGRVGMLHYEWPRPPANARSVAAIGVLVGFANRIRCFSVFERAA